MRKKLRSYFEEPYIKTTLLFRASIDGKNNKFFHQYCDYEGPTLSIVNSGNRIFGGFTTRAWEGDNLKKRDTDAFLFQLNDNIKLLPCVEYPIYCDPNHGPNFGDLILNLRIEEYDEYGHEVLNQESLMIANSCVGSNF
jgi:hypothetical protein